MDTPQYPIIELADTIGYNHSTFELMASMMHLMFELTFDVSNQRQGIILSSRPFVKCKRKTDTNQAGLSRIII